MALKGINVNGTDYKLDYQYLENKPYIDSSPVSGSSNLISSGAVYTATQKDTTPQSGSSRLITSGAVYTALSGKQATLTFDSTPTSGSSRPVTSGGIYTALSKDTTPTYNSSKLITSGAVYTALGNKCNKSETTTSVTNGSSYLVTSGAVYTAINNLANRYAPEFKDNSYVSNSGINTNGYLLYYYNSYYYRTSISTLMSYIIESYNYYFSGGGTYSNIKQAITGLMNRVNSLENKPSTDELEIRLKSLEDGRITTDNKIAKMREEIAALKARIVELEGGGEEPETPEEPEPMDMAGDVDEGVLVDSESIVEEGVWAMGLESTEEQP